MKASQKWGAFFMPIFKESDVYGNTARNIQGT